MQRALSAIYSPVLSDVAAIPPELKREILRLAFLQPMDPVHRAALELAVGIHPDTGVVREGDLRRLVLTLRECLRG